jgi:outer membrane protein OmpA-like peptidoglycan-associated protein
MLSLALLSLAVAADDALSMSAIRQAQEGLSAPSITFQPGVSGRLAVTLSCGATPFSYESAIRPGEPHTLELNGLPLGGHDCRGTVRLTESGGGEGEVPLELHVDVLPPLHLSADRASLDLDGRVLTLSADRPLSRYEVAVFGEGGERLGSGAGELLAQTEAEVRWEQSEGEVLKLDITAWDEAELAGKLELSPWSYAIPHEDVEFPTGSAEILPAEAPKLEKAWADLQDVLARYGAVVEVRLYVAGYTDTVGDAASNQALSESRARAIAGWFRQRGFSGPIAYQGFGESAPAVSTPDETDEPRNRRAVYLLAAEAPPAGGELPRDDWRPL